jgi:hypothetical protein
MVQTPIPFHKTQLAKFNKATLQRCHASHSNGHLVHVCYFVLCMMKALVSLANPTFG